MWCVNLLLTILLLVFFLYMFVKIKMYVDAKTNVLEDYINGIKEVTAEAFKKLSDKSISSEKSKKLDGESSQLSEHMADTEINRIRDNEK